MNGISMFFYLFLFVIFKLVNKQANSIFSCFIFRVHGQSFFFFFINKMTIEMKLVAYMNTHTHTHTHTKEY